MSDGIERKREGVCVCVCETSNTFQEWLKSEKCAIFRSPMTVCFKG